MTRHSSASHALILAALLRAVCAFELNLVAEVVGGAAAASWAFQSFQDSQRKQAVSAANAESKERLEERRQRAFIEPRESWREADLKDYDGTDYDGPILLGADGRVFNVWRGRHFYAPGGPYASMAGRDATRQLAKNRLDGDPDYEPDDGAPQHKLWQLRIGGSIGAFWACWPTQRCAAVRSTAPQCTQCAESARNAQMAAVMRRFAG